MPFEEQLVPKISQINPGMKIIDTLEEIELIYGEAHYHYDEEGNPYPHEADEPDPHVWLGPGEVRKQIKSIFQALVEMDPEGKNLYEKAFRDFDNEIVEMDLYFREILSPVKGKSILTFHPAFAYFTSSYGITQKAIELDGKEPSPRHLERMIDEAIQEGTEVIFTQPEFPQRSARLIANAIGGRVVSLNTLDPDWPKVMKTIAEAIAEGVF
jgi:zinc transport system substrate-binding protein